MRRELFKGFDVLDSGSGQCEHCRAGVVRVLVAEPGGRRWHAAEIGNYGYIPHNCRPSDDKPLRKAA